MASRLEPAMDLGAELRFKNHSPISCPGLLALFLLPLGRRWGGVGDDIRAVALRLPDPTRPLLRGWVPPSLSVVKEAIKAPGGDKGGEQQQRGGPRRQGQGAVESAAAGVTTEVARADWRWWCGRWPTDDMI